MKFAKRLAQLKTLKERDLLSTEFKELPGLTDKIIYRVEWIRDDFFNLRGRNSNTTTLADVAILPAEILCRNRSSAKTLIEKLTAEDSLTILQFRKLQQAFAGVNLYPWGPVVTRRKTFTPYQLSLRKIVILQRKLKQYRNL